MSEYLGNLQYVANQYTTYMKNKVQMFIANLPALLLIQFILTEKEVLAKTKMWMAENADYLAAQKGTVMVLNQWNR